MTISLRSLCRTHIYDFVKLFIYINDWIVLELKIGIFLILTTNKSIRHMNHFVEDQKCMQNLNTNDIF